MRVAPVRVLYLGGAGRSGSTLVGRLLGQVPGFVSAGEVVHLWRRGVVDDELCACGERFHSCPFWSDVGERAFGGWDSPEAAAAAVAQRRVDRTRFIPLTLAPSLPRSYRADLERYAGPSSSLYRAISDVAGGAIVVDSSKHASTAFLLRRVPGVDLGVVHVVRDSRGVASSLAKRVRRPEVIEGQAFMPTATPIAAAAQWLAFNALFEALVATGTPRTLVRYEALIEDPRGELERILDRVVGGRAPGDLAFVDGDRVRLGVDHTVAGNPMRFRTGEVELRLDDAWRSSMPGVDRFATTALTWPLLLRYGYGIAR